MTLLARSGIVPVRLDLMVVHDVSGRGATALRRDGTTIPVALIYSAAHRVGTQTVINHPTCADSSQLARVTAGLLDIGSYVFGEDWPSLVLAHGDPNDDTGSGIPDLGAYGPPTEWPPDA